MAGQPRTEQPAVAVAPQSASPPSPATHSQPPPAVAASDHAAAPAPHPARRLIIIGIVVALVAAGLYFGLPAIVRMLNTVSTDDAYVNGHVTMVAPRVSGQVAKVFVDDNDRVRRGDLLVQLDKRPFEITVEAKKASYEVAQANVVVANDSVRSSIGQVRASRFKLQHAVEDVNNQIASLHAAIAALDTSKANYKKTQESLQIGINAQAKSAGSVSQEDMNRRKAEALVGEAQVKQALQQVYQIRVSLGLPQEPKNGDLGEVPEDLSQNFSTVRQAVAEVIQNAAPLGILPTSFNVTPKQLIDDFYKRDPDGNLDNIYAKIVEDAPAIKLAKAKELEAKSDLDQAELNLSYCDVFAEIDGLITRRDVNPGNNVVSGQSVMALRSITDIWVDANFKETQLSELRIGQPVDLEVDMYGSRQQFAGRISGFTYGTGSTLSLLPAENATGNFVKVVQRLPVRIEILNYDPDTKPLFVGASVTPYVRYKEAPSGENAGKLLQPEMKRLQVETKSSMKLDSKSDSKSERKPDIQPAIAPPGKLESRQ